MSIIHILQFSNEDCTTHTIDVENITHVRCKYPVKIKGGVGDGQKDQKEKHKAMDIFLSSGAKVSLYLNGKTVFRIIDDGPVSEVTSLLEFEKSLIELLRVDGVYSTP